MPHFDANGEQEWVCQVGAHVCIGDSVWLDGIGNVCSDCAAKREIFLVAYTKHDGKGKSERRSKHYADKAKAMDDYNKLLKAGPLCRDITMYKLWSVHFPEATKQPAKKSERPMSVYEHAKKESGLSGLALKSYISRYYGLD